MIPFIQTDSGREASGVTERADCTVRAVAAALALDYRTAHGMLARAGRKNNRGFRFREPAIEGLGFESLPEYSCKSWTKVSEALPKRGSFIVRVRSHVFAVVDGTIRDTHQPLPGKHVKMVYGLKAEATNL
jgi:hypothetical protein